MKPGDLAGALSGVGTTVRVLGRAGVIRPYGPRTLAGIGRVVLRWGTGPAGGFATLAARSPHQVGVVDELGELTWGELHRRSNSLARALAERGVREGDSVAVMCRNHRGFIDASVAVAKLGADILYLNTAFAGPQLVDVLEREAPSMVIHDEEFTGLLAGASVGRRVLAWTDDEGVCDERLDRLVSAYDESDLHPPQRHARDRDPHLRHHRHAQGRAAQGGGDRRRGVAAVADAAARGMAYAHRGAAVPHVGLRPPGPRDAAGLDGGAASHASTPSTALRTAQDERCQSMVVIPVMLQRMLALDPARAGRDRPRPGRGRRVVRVGAARHAGAGLDGPLRRQPLQHLRLDRGGVRLDRHPRGPAGRPDVGGQAAPRHRRQDPRRGRRRAPARARPAGSSWATACSSRATPTVGPRRSSTD